MDRRFRPGKLESSESTEVFKERINKIVQLGKVQSAERLNQLKIDLDDYLEQLKVESDVRRIENVRAAIEQAFYNYQTAVANINLNWAPDLQNLAKEKHGIILAKVIQEILSVENFDIENATKKLFPEPPKR